MTKTAFKLIAILALALVYYVTGRLGQLYAVDPGFVTPIWPPSGFSLAGLLIFGNWVWPGIFLGSFLNNLLLYPEDFSLITALLACSAIAIGATVQALVAAYFCRLFSGGVKMLDRSDWVFNFLMIILSINLIGSTFGTLAFLFSKQIQFHEVLTTFGTWWVGDTAGVLIFTPMILSWIKQNTFFSDLKHQWFEISMWILCAFLIVYLGYSTEYPVAFAFFPLMVWAAFKFGEGATPALVLVSLLCLWATANGWGFFSSRFFSQAQAIQLLEIFLGVLSVSSLLIVAALNQRKKANFILQHYSEQLERKVKKRTQELEERLVQVEKMQQQIVAQEKLASLGVLTAGIAHEIRNPLNFILNFADLAKEAAKNKDEETLNINLNKIDQYGKTVGEIVNSMLMHARDPSGAVEKGNLNEACLKSLNFFYHGVRASDPQLAVIIKTDLDPKLNEFTFNPQKLGQILINLLSNAFYAVKDKKDPLIQLKTQERESFASISITDNGVGIPSQLIEEIFIPFFTTKPPGEGTGLGLSITRDLVTSSGGSIDVESEQGSGTTFTILLPK